ncbi:hypothetical protein ACQEWB_28975 [Streptomyces sp. CA-249302]|uniref:hypothetical protein n=1 Tax=Streptomyces sp. CA-249302 TaxID=3240058 RepID=UPI003D93DBAB
MGFYEKAEEILALKSSTAVSDEHAILLYLEAGEPLVATGSWVDDLLDPDITRVCQYSIRTDGVWVWPSTLPYYLAKHHIRLPDDFLRHMSALGWAAPMLDEDTMDTVVDQFMLEESVDPEDPSW